MDHANAVGNRVVGAANLDRLPIDQDLTRVALVKAVEDLHQRAFARAIFAQQGVDLAGLDGQIDLVVGQNAGEAFGDFAHFKQWRHGL